MNLLKQIHLWHSREEHQRIVEAVEGLPREERTAQLVSLQARAYIHLAGAGGQELKNEAVQEGDGWHSLRCLPKGVCETTRAAGARPVAAVFGGAGTRLPQW